MRSFSFWLLILCSLSSLPGCFPLQPTVSPGKSIAKFNSVSRRGLVAGRSWERNLKCLLSHSGGGGGVGFPPNGRGGSRWGWWGGGREGGGSADSDMGDGEGGVMAGVGVVQRGRHQSPLLTMTNVLTFLNVATYLMQMRFPSITSAGWKLASAITVRKQWYRLLTPVFLHGSVAHLLVNSYSLRAVGPVVEGVMGKAKFLGIYLLAGISGNVLSCIVNPRMPAVGASGAIFGMIGAWGAFLLTNYEAVGEVAADRALAGVGQTVMINLMLGMSSRQIDNMGHLGGFLGGAAVAYIIGPRLSRRLNPFTGESYLVNEQRQFASPLLRRLMGGDRSSWQQPYQQEKRWP